MAEARLAEVGTTPGTFTIYRRLVGARIRSDYQYRTSFWLFAVGQALATLLDFLAIAVIFGRVDRLGGWSLSEVVFLYATSSVAFSIADVVVSQIESLSQRV